MDLHPLEAFLLWNLAINYLIMIIWFAAFVFAHDGMYRLHNRWFPISMEHFNAIHYLGISIYKIGVLLFNLVPWLALQMMGSS